MLLKRLEVVETALAEAKESRVAMELAEAKVALANMELESIELRHQAHRERVAREAVEKELASLRSIDATRCRSPHVGH